MDDGVHHVLHVVVVAPLAVARTTVPLRAVVVLGGELNLITIIIIYSRYIYTSRIHC